MNTACVVFYSWTMMTILCLFCKVVEISSLKYIGVTSLTFLRSRDVIGHETVGSIYPECPNIIYRTILVYPSELLVAVRSLFM